MSYNRALDLSRFVNVLAWRHAKVRRRVFYRGRMHTLH